MPVPVVRSNYLPAQWPVIKGHHSQPANVFAYTTTRCLETTDGSYSEDGFARFNLASHVGDDIQAVQANRKKLSTELNLPSEPVWLDQVHSNMVIHADRLATGEDIPQADASVSSHAGIVCVVLTADCLPVFFCNKQGTEVAVAHAGWRGLHAGILSNTVDSMKSSAEDILVSLGPAIGPRAFEVGSEVYQAFTDKNQQNKTAFTATDEEHYLCDIYQLARLEMLEKGVSAIAGGEHCTFEESQLFYSYRRQQNTGRIASLIWFE